MMSGEDVPCMSESLVPVSLILPKLSSIIGHQLQNG